MSHGGELATKISNQFAIMKIHILTFQRTFLILTAQVLFPSIEIGNF